MFKSTDHYFYVKVLANYNEIMYSGGTAPKTRWNGLN